MPALAHFAKVVAATLGEDFSRVPGVGAAGGLGFAARAFLRARFRPGIELVAELAGLADALVGADLVLTGEGRLDAQSLHGKTPVGVARIARQAGVPVVALAGSLGDGYQRLHDAGIDAAFSLAPGTDQPGAGLCRSGGGTGGARRADRPALAPGSGFAGRVVGGGALQPGRQVAPLHLAGLGLGQSL
ncbi:Putative glycerate kinase [Pseudomonas aeruginosa]|nr:Putative glycerate kinase [Pseudomonas aeruginosa]